MAPREHHVIEATVRLVHSIFSGIDWIFRVRVSFEGLGVDNLVRELAANDEGVLREELCLARLSGK